MIELRLMAEVRRLRQENDDLAAEVELWRQRAWLMADIYVVASPSQEKAA